MELSTLLTSIFLTAAEFGLLALLFGGAAFGLGRLLRLLVRVQFIGERISVEQAQRTLRGGLLLLFLLSTGALLLFNVTTMVQGREVRVATAALLTTALPPGFWGRLAWALAQVTALVVVARLALRLVVRVLPTLEARVRGQALVRISDTQLRRAFALVQQTLQLGVWLFVGALCARILGLPALVAESLAVALRILLIIQVGRLLIALLGTIIDTLDALSEKYLRSRRLDLFYDQLRGIVPLISRALQYIILVQVVSLALAQIGPLASFAGYGARAIQVIGIVFIGLVLIEVLRLLVDALYLVRGELSDAQWQQRLTFGPLLKNAAQYVMIFGGSLLVLTALGFNIGPILVGLGGLGLVVGLAAQPVTTDLISGLFILFENLFLVGDYIETGNARGVVETIDVRTTRIRDPDGQLHLVRNGQIGAIVNYSKGYVYSVVLISVVYETDLAHAFAVIDRTGRELDAQFDDVLEPTLIQGVEEFADGKAVIRTITRVRPGRHQQMARELRKLIKLAFDREAIAMQPDDPVLLAAPSLLFSERAVRSGDQVRPMPTGDGA